MELAIVALKAPAATRGGVGEEVRLRGGGLDHVPVSLRAMPRLLHLDLRSNALTSLPGWVADLPALERLDVRWNPLRVPPALAAALERRGCVVHH
ncbi:hypothetical protein [Spirillospora sp. CA-294931]|uniref:hypothetical protein n=1 Tax=Spirillospora sp. CA-294931 TaxID=3240042 RepID=UPI003D8E7803